MILFETVLYRHLKLCTTQEVVSQFTNAKILDLNCDWFWLYELKVFLKISDIL